MHQTGGLRNEEANAAAWEAGKGAAVGGAKWGLFAAALGGAGYALSPIYKGLTIQFKVFIQMGFMVMGGSLEADRRIREYEAKVRMEKRMIRDRAVWNQFEEEYEQSASKQDKSG
ncbi:putative imidazoleglycerol-phosphate dehydratase protein [Botrytis fragariae]|uniref:Putative imidazoleglycerol-phosphate dehydratase protein n=1 Tax=Botrytis fragariae TaxID=1964551 RepID=A0A8H6B4V1_9HELO|nr:putative imidazoleglycerol-phosphate dehydratase protein [Botrytis fragariae]KAF5879426.1 putative imidazoleglycerol-phosphate dehydratase protein [Botrytis fragariae]